MKLDERRKPQDGRFSARIDGRRIDFRVSTFPAYYGEKVVMRILDQAKGIRTIEDLGFSPRQMDMVKKAISAPYGMILITGPTGSGKSTTLYSILEEVDRESYNVLSLEDPVEYQIEGVSQSQVRPEIGYDFSSGLRTTLRQDPDIIMVGEIRDKETAQLAVQAALTGHLLLSTLHTNDSATTLPRLLDMGIEEYLVASTLTMVIGQRLVRKICPNCKNFRTLDENEKIFISNKGYKNLLDLDQKFAFGTGCLKCNSSGYFGRIAIYEILMIDDPLREAILRRYPREQIKQIASQNGMHSMLEDCLQKIKSGKTTISELIRVIHE